jgi:hypothetical protein
MVWHYLRNRGLIMIYQFRLAATATTRLLVAAPLNVVQTVPMIPLCGLFDKVWLAIILTRNASTEIDIVTRHYAVWDDVANDWNPTGQLYNRVPAGTVLNDNRVNETEVAAISRTIVLPYDCKGLLGIDWKITGVAGNANDLIDVMVQGAYS